ncbi:MAG: bifunctional metallophosphatase/5'-nucleotidase [Acidobacteria bacterium]|nr:bifunctional metallophosphatase/5'-nucleotidase [Acidobacteriota bacterium]
MRTFRRFSGAALIAFGLLAAVPAGAAQHQEITILHTSDIHGHVLPFDDARNRPVRYSLAQVATVVERVRAAAHDPVLLLDSGDTIEGTPFEEFIGVRWGRPSPTIAAMNVIGYRAMAVGNHEFNFGLDVLRRDQREAHFPLLSANTISIKTGKPAFKPYIVVQEGRVRVGILGLTTPRIPGWEMPAHYRGLRFEQMDVAARKWVPILRKKEHCGLVVVIAHTGFERDLKTGTSNGSEAENFAWRLSEVPGIDVLLTGHTHINIPPRMLHGVIVSQPWCWARRVTRIDLDLVRTASGWKIASWKGENLSTADAPPDPRITRMFAAEHRKVIAALDGPVGHVTAPLSVHGCRLHDCAALDLIHAVQLDASGAQLSLASLLTDRTPDLPAGPVTWRWVYALYVYPNTLVSVRLTGAQVKDVLEHAALYDAGLDCRPGNGCTLLTNRRVRRYNVDTMEGLSYRIDPTRPAGQRVWDLRYHGKPLDLHRSFTVVCNNYRAAGGGGFPHLSSAPVVWHTSEEMTDLIGNYLERHDPLKPAADGNWVVAPHLLGERPLSTGTNAVKVSP